MEQFRLNEKLFLLKKNNQLNQQQMDKSTLKNEVNYSYILKFKNLLKRFEKD